MTHPDPTWTFPELLELRASERGDAVAYTLLGDGNAELEEWTFAELRRRALGVAARLRETSGLGDRALLIFPQSLEFIAAFFGCLYAGVIPVPVTVPNRRRGMDIVRRIAGDCEPSLLLSTGATLEQLLEERHDDPLLGSLSFLDTQACPDAQEGFQPPATDPASLALLQYTSGSTRAPRGVVVSHENLIANHRQIASCLDSGPETVHVSWLPMFHDMGLAIALQAVWLGVRCVLLSPRVCFQEPRRWLQAISRYRATVSGGPNSIYALCLQRLSAADRRGLDLSSWRVAFNGSEPVHISTLERFAEAFADCGFRREALHPVYGLAEATVLAASEPPGIGPIVRQFSALALERERAETEAAPGSGKLRALVSCGAGWPGTELIVVDATTRQQCPPGQAGEIWIRGSNVAQGYWNRPEETEATFRLLTADGRGGFMRSGDLGVVCDESLFVLGRQRDLVRLAGRTHYPHEIEHSASSSHPALVPHAAAAILAKMSGVEQLVIVQEVSRSALRTLSKAAVIAAIRRAVADHHQLQVHAIALIMPATLPRTTSGKVRRAQCREAFLTQSLSLVELWADIALEARPFNAL